MGDILTSSQYDELLSDEAQSEGDIDLRVEVAELLVVDRYRTSRKGSLEWYYDGQLDSSGTVKLAGYREDDTGTFDAQASDEDLTRRLRIVIAKVVEWILQRDELEALESESVGQKSAAYADLPKLPSRLFRLLKPYDDREPIGGLR